MNDSSATKEPLPNVTRPDIHLIGEILPFFPHLDIQKDAHLLQRWAMLAYLATSLQMFLLTLPKPPFIEARLAPALDDYVRLCTLLLRYEETLGITPAARLKLGETGGGGLLSGMKAEQ